MWGKCVLENDSLTSLGNRLGRTDGLTFAGNKITALPQPEMKLSLWKMLCCPHRARKMAFLSFGRKKSITSQFYLRVMPYPSLLYSSLIVLVSLCHWVFCHMDSCWLDLFIRKESTILFYLVRNAKGVQIKWKSRVNQLGKASVTLVIWSMLKLSLQKLKHIKIGVFQFWNLKT